MLIQELLKRTPAEHVDYKNLETALEKIVEVAALVNEAKRKDENYQIVMALSEKLKGRMKNLVVPRRHFIRKGALYLECQQKGIEDWYDAHLFNDMLVLVPQDDDASTDVSKYEFLYFAFAEHVEQEEGKSDDAERTNFVIEAVTQGAAVTFTFTTDQVLEREEWEGDISLAIAECVKHAQKMGIDNTIHSKKDRVEKKRVRLAEKNIPVKKMTVQKYQNQIEIKQEQLSKIEGNVQSLETQYATIWAKLEEERQQRDKLVKEVNDIIEKNGAFANELSQQLSDLATYDTVIWDLLNQDMEAFKEVFSDTPVLTEAQLNKASAPIIQKAPANPSAPTTTTTTAANKGIINEVPPAGQKKPVRVDGEHPYIAYWKEHLYQIQFVKIPIEDGISEHDEEAINPLFKHKPLMKWFKVEQEVMPHKYAIDRLHHGTVMVDKPSAQLLYDKIFDREDLYINDVNDVDDELPNDVHKLKEIILALRKEVGDLRKK